ncbi:SUF system Fe-S cluster assembly regulator [Carnimonas nigrificans]|uniref:SUF system Fe-S cluster assembly regulator n=1 Tax=Carnimonas nigrificans TaxID=64323 RepID=UPI000472BD91|nr:SUF system Fe-S cluster assembly regulator [Carnimonas nigrificans]
MLKLSKLSDYAAVVLAQIARQPQRPQAAPELAEEVHLPRPTVSKTLKMLHKAGLVESRRGVQGGYLLARSAEQIRVSDIIAAIEGPVAMTACSHSDNDCELAALCGVADNWQRVSLAMRQMLDSITLAHLAQREPLQIMPARALAPSATTFSRESLLVSDADS